MSLLPLTHETVVEFAETDAAGLLHFSHYLRYVERAERVLFEALGQPLLADGGANLAGFPRTRVRCDYRAPLRFGDRVRITLEVAEVGDRSLHYRFRLDRLGDNGPESAAKGEMTTVFATLDRASGQMESAALPTALRSALAAALGPVSGEES